MTATDTASSVDFPVISRTTVKTPRQLVELFRARGADEPPIRLGGRLSRQRSVPAPSAPVRVVSLAGMDRILRLVRDDLTCTVEAGVTRAELDAELDAQGLWLPCEASGGTIGGAFATAAAMGDAPGPSGFVSPRALLLGMSGVLAEGLEFKVGARVVKSVAGFDLHKLFVGSCGTLFAATELHLKLRPRPRCSVEFGQVDLEIAPALALFDALRLSDVPPATLWLSRQSGASTFGVHGRLDGSTRVVVDCVQRHALTEARIPPRTAGAGERVTGSLPPSGIRRLVDWLPVHAALHVAATGRFEIDLPGAETGNAADALLQVLPTLCGVGTIARGSAQRRGHGTPLDPGASRTATRLRDALDPGRVLR